jgi:NTE family protein
MFDPKFASLHEAFAQLGEMRTVEGGTTIWAAGGPADELMQLEAGRLAVLDQRGDAAARVVAVHRPGAVLGGIAFLTGQRQPFSVSALRDTVLRVLPRAKLEPLLRRQPALMADLAREALTRAREPDPASHPRAAILGFVSVCDGVAMRKMVEALAERMRRQGFKVAVLGAEFGEQASYALSGIESRNDFVLMAAERAELDFAHYCGRQIDRLFLVGNAASLLPEGPITFAASAIRQHRLLDMIVLQPPEARLPENSTRWLSAAPVARLFHLRRGDLGDLDRLARTLTGRSVAVVLSGGGARAYAHIGVLKALRELDVAVDLIGGTSMGAVIAAGVAIGWSPDEMDQRIREAFVQTSPLSDMAFPLLALTRGTEVDRRLKQHFDDVQISDLWLPFFCVSTNLTTGLLKEHRSGRLRDALRASISLPGILPPVVEDGQVLVDGALVRNLPADLMRERHDGLTIGVDVAQAAGLEPGDLELHPKGMHWLTSGGWMKGPPIVSVLIRAATLPTAKIMARGVSEHLDVLIAPELEGIGLQDWKAYDRAVEAGYHAAMAMAEKLTHPVAHTHMEAEGIVSP